MSAAHSYIQDINGDLWLLSNAYWDGSNWQRVDTTTDAFALNLRGTTNIPGTSSQGAALWKVAPGANPINPTFGVAGGWQVMWSAIDGMFGVGKIPGYGMDVTGDINLTGNLLINGTQLSVANIAGANAAILAFRWSNIFLGG